MADMVQNIFRRRKVSLPKLLEYGFRLGEGGEYEYSRDLRSGGFRLTVRIAQGGEVFTQVVDMSSGEPYTLHLAEGAAGSFVGGVRSEFEEVLTAIAEGCFVPDVFKTTQAKQMIGYMRDTYGDEPEFLWKKFPDNAVWRRKDNRKWYGAILTVSQRKLGLDSDEMAEIINFRYPPAEIERLVDGVRYFPGWHMNKKNWVSVLLDGGAVVEEIQRFLDGSYRIAGQ